MEKGTNVRERLGDVMDFKIKSDFKPTGDQPEAIREIVNAINHDEKFSTLLGVTGSGKTFTMANIIQEVKKPTLILAHNKTLAAQLYSEFKEFFPDNAVEYFVSYYDYYQPEAYVAHSDTYIEKDASINDEIDKLRHSATASILEREDTIIVSSVSCIYGIGDPKDYKDLMLSLREGMQVDRDDVKVTYIPANDIAGEMGMPKVANMIMLGACLKVTNAVDIESVLHAFLKVFGERKSKFIPINREALQKGMDAVS